MADNVVVWDDEQSSSGGNTVEWDAEPSQPDAARKPIPLRGRNAPTPDGDTAIFTKDTMKEFGNVFLKGAGNLIGTLGDLETLGYWAIGRNDLLPGRVLPNSTDVQGWMRKQNIIDRPDQLPETELGARMAEWAELPVTALMGGGLGGAVSGVGLAGKAAAAGRGAVAGLGAGIGGGIGSNAAEAAFGEDATAAKVAGSLLGGIAGAKGAIIGLNTAIKAGQVLPGVSTLTEGNLSPTAKALKDTYGIKAGDALISQLTSNYLATTLEKLLAARPALGEFIRARAGQVIAKAHDDFNMKFTGQIDDLVGANVGKVVLDAVEGSETQLKKLGKRLYGSIYSSVPDSARAMPKNFTEYVGQGIMESRTLNGVKDFMAQAKKTGLGLTEMRQMRTYFNDEATSLMMAGEREAARYRRQAADAVSKDIEGLLGSVDESLVGKFKAANHIYKKKLDRIDEAFGAITKDGNTPESIVRAALSEAQPGLGATRLKAIYKEMPAEGRDLLNNYLMQQAGYSSNQPFSMRTWVANIDKMERQKILQSTVGVSDPKKYKSIMQIVENNRKLKSVEELYTGHREVIMADVLDNATNTVEGGILQRIMYNETFLNLLARAGTKPMTRSQAAAELATLPILDPTIKEPVYAILNELGRQSRGLSPVNQQQQQGKQQ